MKIREARIKNNSKILYKIRRMNIKDYSEIIGLWKKTVGVGLNGNDGRRGHIYHLMVKSEYRNSGIGKELLNKVENGLKKQGIRKIFLVVFKNNILGSKFWENNGYKMRKDLIYRDKIIKE